MRGIMDDLNTSVPPLSSYSGISFQHNLQMINFKYFAGVKLKLILYRGKMGPGGGGQGDGGGGGAYTHPHR